LLTYGGSYNEMHIVGAVVAVAPLNVHHAFQEPFLSETSAPVQVMSFQLRNKYTEKFLGQFILATAERGMQNYIWPNGFFG